MTALRRATPADADGLVRLARLAYGPYVPMLGREPLPMAADWSALLSVQEIWVLDGQDGEPTASLALEPHPDHVLIWSVAVTPAAQRAGLGRSLLAFAEVRCRELGRSELRLYTNARMERNIALYRRLGYTEVRREPLADRVLVHMTKAV